MKKVLALTSSIVLSSLCTATIDKKNISQVANQANTTAALYPNVDESSANKEATKAVISSLDNNFYQISDYRYQSANTPMKLGLLGAGILIAFITHRRMNVDNA